MLDELSYDLNASFLNAGFRPDSEDWVFAFAGGVWAGSTGFWRLIQNGEIICISLDHGHRFGVPEPVDLSTFLNRELREAKLVRLFVASGTGDLTLAMTDGFQLQIFTSSTGYETYEFSIGGKRYIRVGSSDIAIMDVH